MGIKENVEAILKEIGGKAIVEAAAKTRTAREINEAIEAGIKIIGENYIQDFKKVYDYVKRPVRWHFIGSTAKQKHQLLRTKYLKAFDMIETLCDYGFALELNTKCASIDKIMPVLIEVNSAEEPQKDGIMPEEVEAFIEKVYSLKNIKIEGLMTMGPADLSVIRKYFRLTKELFDYLIKKGYELKYLSMGMSDSYKIAIEEGANIVRIGSKIFGPRT